MVDDMKRYTDVTRLGHKSTVGVLNEGDHIVIQEKLDGANASFKLSDDEMSVLCFSRNIPLSETETLRGFYQWVTTNVDQGDLVPGFTYFGEWLVRHKLNYGDNENTFYLFDVYDNESDQYVTWREVCEEAVMIGVNTVPTFYEGPYVSYEHLQQFVGQSKLRERGEGIVVKNYAYRSRWGAQMFVKLVTPEFAEVQHQRLPKDPNAPESSEMQYARTFVTKARVDKFIHKLIDEGTLETPWGPEDMGLILRELNLRIYDDLLKEEADSLPAEYDAKELRKSIGRIIPLLVKEIGGFR